MQDVVLVDGDVFEALPAPLLGDPLREFVVTRRTSGMRLGGEIAMEFRNLIGGREGAELIFERGFFYGRVGRKTGQPARGIGCRAHRGGEYKRGSYCSGNRAKNQSWPLNCTQTSLLAQRGAIFRGRRWRLRGRARSFGSFGR